MTISVTITNNDSGELANTRAIVVTRSDAKDSVGDTLYAKPGKNSLTTHVWKESDIIIKEIDIVK